MQVMSPMKSTKIPTMVDKIALRQMYKVVYFYRNSPMNSECSSLGYYVYTYYVINSNIKLATYVSKNAAMMINGKAINTQDLITLIKLTFIA